MNADSHSTKTDIEELARKTKMPAGNDKQTDRMTVTPACDPCPFSFQGQTWGEFTFTANLRPLDLPGS